MVQFKSLIYITSNDTQPTTSSGNVSPQQISPIAIEFAALLLGIVPFTGAQAKRDLKLIKTDHDQETSKNEQTTALEISNSEVLLKNTEVVKGSKRHTSTSWNHFVEQVPFYSIPKELRFPPGHPMPEKLYRAHPLKTQVYIPIELFDSLLYAEREAELIRILVDLGATKIIIKEVTTGKTESTVRGEAKLVGAGGVSGDVGNQSNESNQGFRTMQLRGKPWIADMDFDRQKYSWLSYEPEWEAVVYARLEGGCLSASIELNSDTSYSISGQIDLTEGLFQDLGSLKAEAKFVRARQAKRLFEVEFANSPPG